MRCLSPRTVGFLSDGKTLAWSQKNYNPEYATFQLPCGKCIKCRLEYARSWAVRCVHEAKMHPENSFITLTYKDPAPERLIYKHFQDFMKRLRERLNGQKISYKVTGEYGDQRKRPHWHALLFNYRPQNLTYMYKNDNGDPVFRDTPSENYTTLDEIWGYNDPETTPTQIGNVTFKSAGYVMRYAAKKLIHGKDEEHDFHPICKGSQFHAIGKTWLEQNYGDILQGYIVLDNGKKTTIPRYYEKWLLKEHPALWEAYVTKIKIIKMAEASEKQRIEKEKENKVNLQRDYRHGHIITKAKTEGIILDQKFRQLQQYLKGDI